MFTVLPLLAFGFSNLLMLGWLGAAAAPLIIHLWNKRKYREVSWAAIEFLLAAMRKNARRIQLQQWLLLAVRTAILILVVLAMAQPVLENLGLNFVSGQRTHRVIVIDASYSMGYRPTDISRFARAKQLATKLVDESAQGDGFTLVLLADPPRVIVGTPALAAGEFIKEIENLKLLHTGADLPGTLRMVSEVIDRAEDENPGLDRHVVYMLSDLARNTWIPELGGGPAVEEYRELVVALSKRASLLVPDLGQSGSENLAVTEVATPESFATVWRDVTLQAHLRNFGTQPYARQLVELLVDDVRVKEDYVDLAPGGQATLSFAHRFETPGPHSVQVRLGGDLLDVDNHRWLSVPVKPHLRVLCISGRQGATDELVLALDQDNSERSLVQPQVAPESALMELDLDQYDCIFLCNVGQFTTSEARLLDAYLQRGGGLVFFLGDRVLADRYNRELGGEGPDGLRILPAQIGDVAAEARYQFDPLGYRHPIVSEFRGRGESGLLSTPINRYFQLTTPEEWTTSSVALAFEGGDPAIVEAPIHRGRSIVVALPSSLASIDPQTRVRWTSIAAWPSFVPIVQELLKFAVSGQRDQFNVKVGDAVGAVLPSAAAGASVTVTDPEGGSRPVSVVSDLDSARWSLPVSDFSGIYTAEQTTDEASRQVFAVNVDTSESDLSKADPDEIPEAFVIRTDWQDLNEQPTGQISLNQGLHRYLLYAALILVLMETILAWRFGRGQAAV
jgi:Mg-chelatase subunit ChlD